MSLDDHDIDIENQKYITKRLRNDLDSRQERNRL